MRFMNQLHDTVAVAVLCVLGNPLLLCRALVDCVRDAFGSDYCCVGLHTQLWLEL